jgi:CHAD domain-containing protein
MAAEKAHQKLRRYVKSLGRLRDNQVQRMLLQQYIARFPDLVSVRDFLHQREPRLINKVASELACFKTRKLEKWTFALCKEIEICSGEAAKRDRLGADVFWAMADAFEEVVRRRKAVCPADSQTIHRVRVAFKKFRYVVEALSPGFTGFGKRKLRRLANYQRRMGNLQDLEILQACVEEFTRQHAGSELFLQPFLRYLKMRRTRVLRTCLRHADDLFGFWDPAWSRQNPGTDLTRSAA